MELHAKIVYLLLSIYMVLGEDIFQGFFRQSEPCFETVKSGCNVSLVPRTLVYLFTPQNNDVAEPLHECGGRLPPGSTYDPDANTEIFIHGWLDGVCRSAWMRGCKDQLYLRAKQSLRAKRSLNANSSSSSYNVILIDWTWGNTPDYYVASQNCKIVGEQVGFVINNIMNQTGAGAEKFHVIGHSFGAIAAGYAGRAVQGYKNEKIKKITALDPSINPFRDKPPNQRVTFRDATIVVVIHTNSWNCFVLGNGDDRQLGHADFYPNGGFIQPNYLSLFSQSLLKKDLFFALACLDPRLCSHLFSIEYYFLSINPNGCQYVGVASNSYEQFKEDVNKPSTTFHWAVMGMDYELYHKNDGRRRKYYLTTALTCPYYDDSYLKGKGQFPFNTSCKSG